MAKTLIRISIPYPKFELQESCHSGHMALTWRHQSKIQMNTLLHSEEIRVSNNISPSEVSYGKLKYRYSGKYSEGNRFITDNDL